MKPKAPHRWQHILPCLALVLGAAALASPGFALTLSFPGPATTTETRQEALTSYRLPLGPWTATGQETRLVEGALDQTAWRITENTLSTLALIKPLREQIAADGWAILYECETNICGGYDFRYATDVMLEPDMHVDLGDFRYLAAERGDEVLSLIVSRSATSGFVQLTRVGAAAPDSPTVISETVGATITPMVPQPEGSIGNRLETGGSIPLDDLRFPSGGSALEAARYESLAELAAYLKANPTRSVTLVGHTDASGGLDGNIALSRKRAQSVRQRLITEYGLPAGQIAAEGRRIPCAPHQQSDR